MPAALTSTFSGDATKARQWNAFVTRGKLAPAELSLPQVVTSITPFLWPPLEAAAGRRELNASWSPKGPTWTSR
jgi:hypothetical protein